MLTNSQTHTQTQNQNSYPHPHTLTHTHTHIHTHTPPPASGDEELGEGVELSEEGVQGQLDGFSMVTVYTLRPTLDLDNFDAGTSSTAQYSFRASDRSIVARCTMRAIISMYSARLALFIHGIT